MEKRHYHPERNKWLTASDNELFKFCRCDNFQASGPGGQKRNRKYSAVRLKHEEAGIEVMASESRSHKENLHNALKKLRLRIGMEIKGKNSPVLDSIEMSIENPRYPCWLATVFDAFHDCEFRIKDAAVLLGISTGKLVRLLARDHSAWQKVNEERRRRNMALLRNPQK